MKHVFYKIDDDISQIELAISSRIEEFFRNQDIDRVSIDSEQAFLRGIKSMVQDIGFQVRLMANDVEKTNSSNVKIEVPFGRTQDS